MNRMMLFTQRFMTRYTFAGILRHAVVALYVAIALPGCDVHEFPAVPDRMPLRLRLNYETDLPIWSHATEASLALALDEPTRGVQHYGTKRYIIRAYPKTKNNSTSQVHSDEFIFTRDVSNGYDCEFTLDLAPGDYTLMVWSDLTEFSGDTPFHDTENFSEITLQGDHRGNCDHRDAFRGTHSLTVTASTVEQAPDTAHVLMERPLAKYEFITTDLSEFLDKEQTRVDAKSKAEVGVDQFVPTKVSLEDYKVVIYYVGFMPHTYSLFTDKPVDAGTGVSYASTLRRLNETEASIGFDYVFVNGVESKVTVQIGIYDREDELISMSKPLEVPLRRSWHTVVRGMFLMEKASGGVSIHPEYEGDHNVFFP